MEDAATGHERSLSSSPPEGEGSVVSRLPDFHDKPTYAAWPYSETRTTIVQNRTHKTYNDPQGAGATAHSQDPVRSARHQPAAAPVRLGIGLGKINYLLKALLEKGLIKAGPAQ